MQIRQNIPASHEEIASVAFGLWEQAGRPMGQDQEFWFRAEQQVASCQNQLEARANQQRSQIQGGERSKPASSAPAPAKTAGPGFTMTSSSSEKGGQEQTGKTATRQDQSRGKKASSSMAGQSQ